ncbi:UDP-2,4-diacetamido-2,4,6-trideoxy-beta-L-altropyranose hydrolase [Clostridium taeniosporum]|uniref:UDP-2,4-diacetamido-2,4, 6-trideoxy-beta-L-altropyranose hydrolase n=1 Tax=Clostridium taeniosporum TaxID=394958 RepID=A0A1D7XHT8_9CLOT|nr:UDP-2,4-diacetamido-2,4,6-trideoxy-beta-L-altropyranose hydrolase [Clostridium taeniosporum]AOR22917.1 UDP-2,4-diacetamido-2,4,6-trideoxy-beta-L-altropyranose hydrolase [Clostridium taeniosporum]
MKIAIRADGGLQIGMGHIMRSLVLAKELKKNNNDVFYVCKQSSLLPEKYEAGINKVKEQGFDVIIINEGDIFAELSKIQADCLITDSYDVNEEYFNIIKKYFKFTGYIDDMNLYYFNVDFIINQNIGAEEWKYKVNKGTKLLLGTDYTMLREEFRRVKDKFIDERIHNIMITVGASDFNGITNKICDYLKELHFKFHVIVGPCFTKENIYELMKLSEKNKNIELHFHADMIKIMNECDICISACGSTLYELASCGIPTIGLIVADNQKKIGEKLNQLKVIKNLGFYQKISKKKLCETIKDLDRNIEKRQEMSKKSMEIVDGKGVNRIVSYLEYINNN